MVNPLIGDVLIAEQYGNRLDTVCKYSISSKGVESVGLRPQSSSVKNWMCNVFLPSGYPTSVTPDYLQYQMWDTLQAFASSLTGALATEAILKGMGVGDSEATSLAASLTWLQKEGAGMVGRIAFAWWKGTSFDCDSKRWRLFADFLNDAAIFLEILAPNFQKLFPVIICVSSVCKSIVGLVGGATRAALTQHQARRNNLADVAAKDGSQETLVNLVALCCNIILLKMVSGHLVLTWTVYIIFTIIHLLANYLAVRSLQMDSINYQRLHILVESYFQSTKRSVLSVAEANYLEPIISGFFPGLCDDKLIVKLGSSVNQGLSPRVFQSFKAQIDTERKYLLIQDDNKVHVMIRNDAVSRDLLMASFSVLCIGRSRRMRSDIVNMLNELDDEFINFECALKEAGWNTCVCLLNFDEWRLTPSV